MKVRIRYKTKPFLLMGLAGILLYCGGNLWEKPLLLDDLPDSESLAETAGPQADNSRCHVCHFNYTMEKLAITHSRANISCEECHGSSDEHCSDEDNLTPPDVMYPFTEINSSCLNCHSKEEIDIQPHNSLLSGNTSLKKYCTDCHGDHRLPHRTRKWNRKTGKLILDDNVRVLTDEERSNIEKK